MKTKSVLLLLLLTLPVCQCKNPFKSEEGQKQRVIILMNNEYLDITGRWVIYWDGKDSNGRYVQAGRYIILMEAKNFNDQNYVTAEEGGKPGGNDARHVEPGTWYSFELEAAYPNPFKVQSGVNIPFLVSQVGRVKISIYKD